MKASTQKSRLSDLKILVVDDDDDLRFLMAKILRDKGYSVSEAASAREADDGRAGLYLLGRFRQRGAGVRNY